MIPCCLNCQAMSFWDGDYVCTMQMKIHQYGYRFPTVPGAEYGAQQGMWMNEDFERTLKTSEECSDWMFDEHSEWLQEEYKKWLKYKKMIKEYETKMRG